LEEYKLYNFNFVRNFIMEILEAIQCRHSVRRYTDKPIEETTRAALEKFIERCNKESKLNIQLVLDEPKAFASKLVTYGQFSGVRNYLVMAGPKGRDWEEKIGYYGEKIVLFAQTLGLNSCWVGLTYKKVPGAYTLREGDIIHCEIAIGYGSDQGKQHPLKPLDKFFEAEGEFPEWFGTGLEAALLAPTAVNQQKFKFILHPGNLVETKTFPSLWGYTQIDLGIVKCHFELAAGKDNFKWV
jgi:nitroreductase